MEVSSQPDLMLYKFVYNTMRARGREIMFSTYFRLGVQLGSDTVCYLWRVFLVVCDVV